MTAVGASALQQNSKTDLTSWTAITMVKMSLVRCIDAARNDETILVVLHSIMHARPWHWDLGASPQYGTNTQVLMWHWCCVCWCAEYWFYRNHTVITGFYRRSNFVTSLAELVYYVMGLIFWLELFDPQQSGEMVQYDWLIIKSTCRMTLYQCFIVLNCYNFLYLIARSDCSVLLFTSALANPIKLSEKWKSSTNPSQVMSSVEGARIPFATKEIIIFVK